MKKKIDFRIPIIIILFIILVVMLVFYFKDSGSNDNNFGSISGSFSKNSNFSSSESDEDGINGTVSSTTSVSSAMSENLELHATYYLEECLVSTNEYVAQGDVILEYTNGKYLKAPYDCVVTEINIPNTEGQCTNEHYIAISATNIMQVQLQVDETIIDYISIGQEATISVSVLEDTIINGYVTDISSTANSGKFTVTVEFENPGDVLIGMTSTVSITY